MDQLARLGVVFTTDGYEALSRQLDQLPGKSKAAETATEHLTDATKKAAPGFKLYAGEINNANAQVTAYLNHQKALKVANDNAAKSIRTVQYAAGGLAQQFADVGVSLAGGMNPIMVFIQQGPQIAYVFQQAAASGVGFKAVLTGLYAQIAPLVAAFAPLIAATAGFGASVFYVVGEYKKQDAAVKELTKSLAEQKKELSSLSPWIFLTGDNANLAAEGQKNFDAWLQKANISIAEQNKLLRENALNLAEKKWGEAAEKLFEAQKQFAKASAPGATMMAGGAGGFSAVQAPQSTDPTNNPFYKEAAANLKVAKEAYQAITAYRQKMMNAPASAFANPTTRTPKPTRAEEAEALARAEGRFSGSPVSRNVESIATQSISDRLPLFDAGRAGLQKSLSNQSDVFGNQLIKSAQDQSDELIRIQKEQAKARTDAMNGMWSNLISLSSSGNKKLAAIGRAAAIAQTVRDTYASATASYKALAGIPVVGPALGAAAAAAAIAAGLANVSRITSTKGYAAGGYTGDGPVGAYAGMVHGQEFVVNAAATRRNRDTLEAMNAGRAIPKNPINDNRRGLAIQVIPGALFDVVVAETAGRVAAPIAQAKSDQAAERAVNTSADLYTRRNARRLY